MMRAVGITELLSALPGAIVVLFALVTQLGDFWFTFSVCALLYLLGPLTPRIGAGVSRDRVAMVLALLVTAVTLTLALKAAFGLPRPPGADVPAHVEIVPAGFRGVYAWMATSDGFGFPSGHAMMTLLVWGGLAWAIRSGTRRTRVQIAGTVVALVGLSRLVLGVHYLVDVLAGFLVAGFVLWLALARLRTPQRVFALSVLIALGGILAAGLTRDTAAALGLAIGGTTAWTLLGERLPSPTQRGGAVTTACGIAAVGSLLVAGLGLELTPPVVLGVAAVGIGLLLALPLAGERVAKNV